MIYHSGYYRSDGNKRVLPNNGLAESLKKTTTNNN